MTTTNTAALADAYAQIRAEKEAITKREEALKAEIVSLGEGELAGQFYTVTYKKTAPVKSFDKDLCATVLASFGLNADQIDQALNATKQGKCQDRLYVKATALSANA